ncbi:hypothetical protein MRX96_055772 [Rhipicephalus microplus]
MTATHLESAALLLETHIVVDDPSKDLPEHAEARQMAARPYSLNEVDVPFTEAAVREVIGAMPPRSSPGPDAITPLLVKGLFKLHARALFYSICWGAFKTTRTTALQVLMRAPPIALELERANAEFDLLIARKSIRYGQLSVRPDRLLPPTGTSGRNTPRPDAPSAFVDSRGTRRDEWPACRDYTFIRTVCIPIAWQERHLSY